MLGKFRKLGVGRVFRESAEINQADQLATLIVSESSDHLFAVKPVDYSDDQYSFWGNYKNTRPKDDAVVDLKTLDSSDLMSVRAVNKAVLKDSYPSASGAEGVLWFLGHMSWISGALVGASAQKKAAEFQKFQGKDEGAVKTAFQEEAVSICRETVLAEQGQFYSAAQSRYLQTLKDGGDPDGISILTQSEFSQKVDACAAKTYALVEKRSLSLQKDYETAADFSDASLYLTAGVFMAAFYLMAKRNLPVALKRRVAKGNIRAIDRVQRRSRRPEADLAQKTGLFPS